jgi:hypothetical protein
MMAGLVPVAILSSEVWYAFMFRKQAQEETHRCSLCCRSLGCPGSWTWALLSPSPCTATSPSTMCCQTTCRPTCEVRCCVAGLCTHGACGAPASNLAVLKQADTTAVLHVSRPRTFANLCAILSASLCSLHSVVRDRTHRLQTESCCCAQLCRAWRLLR